MGLPLAEKILRPIIVYAFLVVSLRLSGKRELVQLNPFDLVVLLTLSNTVQNAIIGEDNSVLGGIIGATSLLVTNYLVVRPVLIRSQETRPVGRRPSRRFGRGRQGAYPKFEAGAYYHVAARSCCAEARLLFPLRSRTMRTRARRDAYIHREEAN